jgi:lipopolysaccharide export system permease protein
VQRLALLCPPVLSRHLLGVFLRTMSLCVGAFLSIYLVVEFFEQFDAFLQHDAGALSIARYFFFRIPMFITRVVPMAVLAGVLLGLGNLGRQNEFVALRAAGVSVWQLASALVLAATLISVAVLLWNEHVVPYASQHAHDIYAGEIRKRPFKGKGRRQVWYRGLGGFYNIKHVSAKGLVGLTVYQLDGAFQPRRVVEVDRATWDATTRHWNLIGSRGYRIQAGGRVESEPVDGFELPETPADFLAAPGEVEEFNFSGLRRYITDLRRKGADPSEYFVELHLKLAAPFASLVMVLIAVPLATRGTRTTNLAGAVSFGLAIGFSYWVLLAFAKALGQGGALPPALSAWTANAIFGLLGLFLLLGSD